MNDDHSRDGKALCARHLQFAWWSLSCFVILGISLEGFHAFKVGWYLGPDSSMRRLMWTLAHAHGTLLSLVHAAFAFTCLALPIPSTPRRRLASALLMGASVLLPGGFFLGGAFVYEGDPGVGVWLAPLGALFFLLGVVLTAVDVLRGQRPTDGPPAPGGSTRS